MLTELPPAEGTTDAEPFAGPDHPMRKVTRGVAFDGAWSSERAGKVADLFDSMAADWAADHVDDVKAAPILDALKRGGLRRGGEWAELGSGTGAGTRLLHDRVDRLVATDLSYRMLVHAPDLAPRVQADASTLPFPDDAFDGVLLVNMLLFPAEIDRILRPEGALVRVNSLGDHTPIHLPPADVAAALPGEWSGSTARAGTGLWAVLRRTDNRKGNQR
ncbi:MAG: class I SAM-dependent methyltransferase [Actinomycetota bacterium]